VIRRLHVPLVKPEYIIQHLAKQELHWRAGYSALELAVAWARSRSDFPATVRTVLKAAPEYAHAEFIDGFFEREAELGSPGRNSQTDLMVIAAVGDELAVIAVEGKLEESFAELVADWDKHAREATQVGASLRDSGARPGEGGRHPLSTVTPGSLGDL
jgi:hypothetical protein